MTPESIEAAKAAHLFFNRAALYLVLYAFVSFSIVLVLGVADYVGRRVGRRRA